MYGSTEYISPLLATMVLVVGGRIVFVFDLVDLVSMSRFR